MGKYRHPLRAKSYKVRVLFLNPIPQTCHLFHSHSDNQTVKYLSIWCLLPDPSQLPSLSPLPLPSPLRPFSYLLDLGHGSDVPDLPGWGIGIPLQAMWEPSRCRRKCYIQGEHQSPLYRLAGQSIWHFFELFCKSSYSQRSTLMTVSQFHWDGQRFWRYPDALDGPEIRRCL